MTPESDRALFHLKIGRDLWEYSAVFIETENVGDSSKIIHLISQSVQFGLGIVNDFGELDIIATINLRAGKTAMQSSQFSSASLYFGRAISALGDRQWSVALYDLTLELHNCSSEAYYCIADFDQMELMLEVIFSRATSFEDKLQAYTTQVFANGARNRLQQALSTAFFVLKELGVTLPERPGKFTVIMQYRKTQRMLHRISDRVLLSLPDATDVSKIAAMQILSFAMVFSYLSNPEVGVVTTFRLIQMVLEYGNTASAAAAFAGYGFMLSAHMGNRKDGIRYGNAALALLGDPEERNAKAWLPRTYFLAHINLSQWAFPVRGSLEPLMHAHRTALRTGDMEFAMHSACAYLSHAFYSGKELNILETEARSIICLVDSLGQTMGLANILPIWGMFSDLIGGADPPVNLTSHISDTEMAFQNASQAGNANSLGIWYLYRAIFLCLSGEYHECLKMTKKSRGEIVIFYIWGTFYEGLSLLAIARESTLVTRWANLRLGRKAAKLMKRWASMCPSNCLKKQLLLEAEVATLQGRTSTAFSLFHQSIQTAKKEGFLGGK